MKKSIATAALPDPRLFINRHLAWLDFNKRVLEEAFDDSNPLLERVKFLAITASNLDEFVEVRIAGLLQQVEQGHHEGGPDGLSPENALVLIFANLHRFVEEQYRCWQKELLPALAKEDIRVLGMEDLSPRAVEAVEHFYVRDVEPLLTPVTIDPAHPFPHVLNKALCVAFLLRRQRKGAPELLGVVTVPRALPRLVRLPAPPGENDFIFLHEVIHAHAEKLYRGYEILSAGAFRVTRNSNLYLQEEESRSILESVDAQLHNRRKGAAVRLEIEAGANPEISERLRSKFELDSSQVFAVNGPVNLSRLFSLAEQVQRPELKYHPFTARELHIKPGSPALFDTLRKRDILLHHPFDSYSAVVHFIETAARDPNVLSIKQTLYRTSEDSPIVHALVEAADKKEVTVVVELKASFDEASNIRWARSLEEAGVQVYYGLVGLKTHCKLALVARRDAHGRIRRFAHLGTGNYNPSTARFYTDLSLLTGDEQITSAVSAVFNFLTAFSDHTPQKSLFLAPVNLGKNCVSLIQREAAHAKAGRPARIIAKVNSLVDPTIIRALYAASQAGVQIDLIVRGGCALRPGVPALSSRIRVRSVVGRFLEHSRIFVFQNGGEPEVYLGSADWMPRNLYERVEVMFRLKDQSLARQVCREILGPYLADTRKARLMQPDGSYTRTALEAAAKQSRNGRPASRRPRTLRSFDAQQYLISMAEGAADPAVLPAFPIRF